MKHTGLIFGGMTNRAASNFVVMAWRVELLMVWHSTISARRSGQDVKESIHSGVGNGGRSSMPTAFFAVLTGVSTASSSSSSSTSSGKSSLDDEEPVDGACGELARALGVLGIGIGWWRTASGLDDPAVSAIGPGLRTAAPPNFEVVGKNLRALVAFFGVALTFDGLLRDLR